MFLEKNVYVCVFFVFNECREEEEKKNGTKPIQHGITVITKGKEKQNKNLGLLKYFFYDDL